MDVNNQPHVRTALPWGNSLQCQSNRKVGGPQGLCGRFGKGISLFPNGIQILGLTIRNLAAITTALPLASNNYGTTLHPLTSKSFLDEFAYQRKSPISFTMSSVCMYQHGSTGRIFVTVDFGDFKSDKNIKYLCQDLTTFMLQKAVGNIL